MPIKNGKIDPCILLIIVVSTQVISYCDLNFMYCMAKFILRKKIERGLRILTPCRYKEAGVGFQWCVDTAKKLQEEIKTEDW